MQEERRAMEEKVPGTPDFSELSGPSRSLAGREARALRVHGGPVVRDASEIARHEKEDKYP